MQEKPKKTAIFLPSPQQVADFAISSLQFDTFQPLKPR